MLPGALLIAILTALVAWLAWRGRPAWRADLVALLALTGVLAVFFAPVLAGGMWLPRGGGDLTSFLWPMYRFAGRELSAGRLPLWNPHQHSGAPFIADNQSAVFYPPNLALLTLAPEVPYEALQWLVIFHFWLAGVGMYLCLRAVLSPLSPGRGGRGVRVLPALFGAVAFMLSDVFVTHQGNLNLIAVAAYLPLIFLCVWRAIWAWHAMPRATLRIAATVEAQRAVPPRGHGFVWAVGAGVLFGVATLAGHGQMTLFLALTIGAVGLYALLLRLREGWRAWLWVIGLTAVAGFVGAGIAAVSLLPAAELTSHSLRASISYEEAVRFSLPPRALVGLVAPWVYGRGPDGFTGSWDRVEVGYAGALALAVALYGAWRGTRQRRSRRLARFFIMFGLLALLMALGEHTRLYRLVYDLPMMNSLRAPARFVLLFDFALAGLAALGLQATFVGRGMARVPGKAQPVKVFRASTRYTVHLAPVMVALLAFELIANGAGIEVDSGDPYTGYDHPAVVAWLRAQSGVFRVEGDAPAWQPDAAAFHGLYDIYGLHNPLALSAYDTFHWNVVQRGTPTHNFQGARYVIRSKGDPPAGEPFAADFIPVCDDDPALTVYENTRAFPLAHLVPRAVSVERPEDAWGPIHDPGWDPSAVVYVEGGPPLEGDVSGDYRVEHVVYEPNHLVYKAEASGPAYLVLSEVYYPGWRATIDGQAAPIYRANTAFRAVYVAEAGEHVVELTFAPASFALGALISAVTVATLVVGAGVLWWQTRKRLFRNLEQT